MVLHQRISPAAILAILAVLLAWLSTVLRWGSGSVLVDQSQGLTVFRFLAEDTAADRLLRLFALAVFVLAGVLNALEARRPRWSRGMAGLLGLMLASAVFWFFVSYEPSEYWPALIKMTSPCIFAMCLGIFAGFDPTLWPRFRPVVMVIAWVSVALSAYYTARLTVRGTFEGPNPTVEHLQIAFWFSLGALVLRKSSRWRHCLPGLIPVAFSIPMAVITNSRSLTLLTILGLITGLAVPLRRCFRRAAVRVVALGALTVFVFGFGWWFLSVAAPERVVALNERLLEDTRTSQYAQFFRQVPVTGLITGLGPRATYSFNDRANYEFIDNQFLFILFKFGVPVLLGYCAVVLWPGLRLLLRIRRGNREQWPLVAVIVFWTLAGLGLSIFHAIMVNPQNLLMILLAGRAFALSSATRERPISRPENARAVRRLNFRRFRSDPGFALRAGTARQRQPFVRTVP